MLARTTAMVGALALMACAKDGGSDPAAPPAGSPALAITDDALYFVRDSSVTDEKTLVRYERATGEETTMVSSPALRPAPLAVNGSRLFYIAEPDAGATLADLFDLFSVPLNGGDPRLEASEVLCVGRGCIAVNDDTLFFIGNDVAIAKDLDTGASTRVADVDTITIAIDDTRLYGASCHELWAAPLTGGEAFRRSYDSCLLRLLPDGDRVLFVTRSDDGGIQLWGAPVDTLVPEPVADLTSLPVIHGGTWFAAIRVDGRTTQQIVRMDGSDREVLAEADGVQGLAIDDRTVYWLERGDITGELRQLSR